MVKTRKVWGWVVNWADIPNAALPLEEHEAKEPNVTVDLFFSTKKQFKKVTGLSLMTETLVPVRVPMDFDKLDFCPDNY
jgi:hypothetical protein